MRLQNLNTICPKSRELFVDTGRHTGCALFQNTRLKVMGQFAPTIKPYTFGFTSSERELNLYLDAMGDCFGNCLGDTRPDRVWLESAEYWGQDNEKSTKSVMQWDLFKLQTLVGVYYRIARSLGIDCQMIFAREWKGQLTKDATKARVKRVTGNVYPNDHITDAVGMGLSVYGLL